MSVRSKQLVLLSLTQAVAGAGTNIYTASPDETTLIKSVYVWNNSANPAVIDLAVRTAAGASFPFNRASVLAGQLLVLDPIWIVLMAGQSIRANPSVTGNFRFLVSGAELEGVAD